MCQRKSHHISIDATYKLIYQNYPLIVVGSTDKNKHFHFFGVAVTSSEETEDFKFVFESVRDGVEKLFKTVYDPVFLVADAAWAIKNADKATFGDDKGIITCYTPVENAVRRWLEKHYGKTNKIVDLIINDLKTLYESPNKVYFEAAFKLFEKRWFNEENAKFKKYFETEWRNHHPNWY